MSVGLGSSPSVSCCHYLLLQVELHAKLLYKSARATDLLQCLEFVATFGMPQALWRAEGLGMIASLHAEYGHLTTFHSSHYCFKAHHMFHVHWWQGSL